MQQRSRSDKKMGRRSFVLITDHAVKSAVDLGIDLPRRQMIKLLSIRARNNMKFAIECTQEGRKKYIIPCVMPPVTQCPDNPASSVTPRIPYWSVLAVPKDRPTSASYRYVMLTVLHSNSPAARKAWEWAGKEDPVVARIQHMKELQ